MNLDLSFGEKCEELDCLLVNFGKFCCDYCDYVVDGCYCVCEDVDGGKGCLLCLG